MSNCKGCGVQMQFLEPTQLGYSPKKGSDYCQRCFRLTHYDDLQLSMKTGIDPTEILKRVDLMDALVVWVVDLFDFESSMMDGIHRHLPGKEILLVATKRDLLPDTMGNEKLGKFILSRSKTYGLQLAGLVVTGKNIEEGSTEVLKAVKQLSKGRPIVVLGKANAGKSTLLNALMKENKLTSSRYPGTTLDFNPLLIEGLNFIDTPGIEGQKTMLMVTEEKDLKNILPYEPIKSRVFQCRGDQSFAIGGLARVDVIACEKASIVFYVSNRLDIHRGKRERADELWKTQYGSLLNPTPQVNNFTKTKVPMWKEKVDVVIDGLGWISISGTVKEIEVHYPKEINVTFRKAMI